MEWIDATETASRLCVSKAAILNWGRYGFLGLKTLDAGIRRNFLLTEIELASRIKRRARVSTPSAIRVAVALRSGQLSVDDLVPDD